MRKKPNFFKASLSYDTHVFNQYKYQIDLHSQLLDLIKSILPEKLAQHALFCVSSGKKVSLYTDSSVWSSQLRFYHQAILQVLHHSNLVYVELLQIKIIPPTQKIEQKNTIELPSKETISLIMDQAQDRENDVLKTAMLKLGNTLSKLSSSKEYGNSGMKN